VLIPSVDAELSQLSGAIFESEHDSGGRYRLGQKLGESTAAVSYLAHQDTGTGSGPVRIKIIRPDLALEADHAGVLMVQKESVSLTRLAAQAPPTPFVLRLLDNGIFNVAYGGRQIELLWLALEYVNPGAEGTTLEQRIAHSITKTGFAFTPQRAGHLISCTTKGLDAVHRVGVIHRNLAPANVYCCGFGEDEVFKIGEFGMARADGLSGTLVKTPIGTAGYAAPEVVHGEASEVGEQADMFSLGALVFYALTGEHLFPGDSRLAGAMVAQREERRSLLDCGGVVPELREREKVCKEIDSVIKLATDPDPSRRPPNGMLLRRALMMSWSNDRRALRTTKARIASIIERDDHPAMEGWTWNVRYKPGDGRVVRSVAWESDGTALAVSTLGLEFWNGSAWVPAVATGMPGPTTVRFAQRVSPGLWLIGGNGATLAQYAREGVQQIVQVTDPSVDFTLATGDECRVLVGEREGNPPSLYTWVEEKWLKPVSLDGVANVADLCRYDANRFLLVGRGADNGGFASLYTPESGEVQRIASNEAGAYLACSGRPELAMAAAVGLGGSSIRIAGDNAITRSSSVSEPGQGSPLSSVAVDIDANVWTTSLGQIWLQAPQAAGQWRSAWQDASWTAPFVSIYADVGLVIAMTVEGAIVEGRAINPAR